MKYLVPKMAIAQNNSVDAIMTELGFESKILSVDVTDCMCECHCECQSQSVTQTNTISLCVDAF